MKRESVTLRVHARSAMRPISERIRFFCISKLIML